MIIDQETPMYITPRFQTITHPYLNGSFMVVLKIEKVSQEKKPHNFNNVWMGGVT